MHICPFNWIVVERRRYSAEIVQENDIIHIVIKPDGSVESHFAVLT
jgi:hypothetical protein